MIQAFPSYFDVISDKQEAEYWKACQIGIQDLGKRHPWVVKLYSQVSIGQQVAHVNTMCLE